MALEPETAGTTAAPDAPGTGAHDADVIGTAAATAARHAGFVDAMQTQDPHTPDIPSATADRISRALVSLLTNMPPPATPTSSPTAAPGTGLTDRASFLERLRSFKPTTWFAAPPGLDPVACACKGWCNIGPELLVCSVCKEQVAMSLPDVGAMDRAKWERAVDALILGLTNRHHRGCPWTGLECAQQVLAYSSQDPETIASDLAARVKQLLQVDYLPDVDKGAIDAVSKSNNTSVTLLTSSTVTLPSPDPQPPLDLKSMLSSPTSQSQWRLTKQQKAVLLALFGWSVHLLPVSLQKLRKEMSTFGVGHLLGSGAGSAHRGTRKQVFHNSSQTVLRCDECHARVGLWQFFNSNPRAGTEAAHTSALEALRRAVAGGLPELLPDPFTCFSPIHAPSTPGPSEPETATSAPVATTPFQPGVSTPAGGAPLRSSSAGLSGLGSPMSSTALLLSRSKSQLRSTIAGGQYISAGGMLDFSMSPKESPFGSKRSEPVFGLAAMAQDSKRQKLDNPNGGKAASATSSPPRFSTNGPSSAPAISTPAPGSRLPLLTSTPSDTVPRTPAVTLKGVTSPEVSARSLSAEKSLPFTDLGWMASTSPPFSSQRPAAGLLDPIEGHRSWCPYVLDHGSGVPGWLAVVQAMAQTAGKGTEKKPDKDALDQAKVFLSAAMRLSLGVADADGAS